MNELYNFSKIHQYDDRKDFKEAWVLWSKDNETIIKEEISRLLQMGYDGDIEEKMFKSARFYFRKKDVKLKEPKVRREYIGVPKPLLKAMDDHIEQSILDPYYQPKTGFVQFCKANENLLNETMVKIINSGIKNEAILEKIKKTYKNRYYMFTSKK
jgi:hypothetical protein